MEKDNFAIRNKTVNEGITDALKILKKSYEGEKETEYDASVITAETNGKHRLLDKKVVKDLVEKLKSSDDNKKMDIDK